MLHGIANSKASYIWFFLFIEQKQEKLSENDISINTLSPQMEVNFFPLFALSAGNGFPAITI